jgi:hypothetical protein
MANDWSYADRISDRIVDMINEERVKDDFSPTQLLVGIVLGLRGYMTTATVLPIQLPPPFIALYDAIADFLNSALRERATNASSFESNAGKSDPEL